MYASTIKWFTSRTRASERSQKPENQNGHRQRSVDLDATLWGRKYENESCDKYMTVNEYIELLKSKLFADRPEITVDDLWLYSVEHNQRKN